MPLSVLMCLRSARQGSQYACCSQYHMRLFRRSIVRSAVWLRAVRSGVRSAQQARAEADGQRQIPVRRGAQPPARGRAHPRQPGTRTLPRSAVVCSSASSRPQPTRAGPSSTLSFGCAPIRVNLQVYPSGANELYPTGSIAVSRLS